MFIDLVVEATKNVLREKDEVTKIVAARKREEVWFQHQIYSRIIRTQPGITVAREKNYPEPNSRDCCDFRCLESTGRQSWVELKLCTTNYLQDYSPSSYNRSTRDQIDNLLYDIRKLRRLPGDGSHWHILLLVYPMPSDYATHGRWPDHIASIRSKGGDIADVFSIEVALLDKKAHVVVYRIDVR